MPSPSLGRGPSAQFRDRKGWGEKRSTFLCCLPVWRGGRMTSPPLPIVLETWNTMRCVGSRCESFFSLARCKNVRHVNFWIPPSLHLRNSRVLIIVFISAAARRVLPTHLVHVCVKLPVWGTTPGVPRGVATRPLRSASYHHAARNLNEEGTIASGIQTPWRVPFLRK